jgi:hypothetical protein
MNNLSATLGHRVSLVSGALAAAGTSIALGFLLALYVRRVETFLLLAIAGVLLVPIAIRVSQRRFDLFEPLVAAAVAFGVMYVARPAALLLDDRPKTFKGYEITGQIGESLLIVLLATAAFQVGYALPVARRLAARLRPAPGQWAVDVTVVYCLGMVLLAATLFSLFLRQSGGISLLRHFLEGRSGAHESLFRNSSAYLYGSPALIWPASLLLFAAGLAAGRRMLVVLAFIAMIPLAIFAGGLGSRVTIIPLVLAPAVYWYLSRQRRPRPLTVALVGYLVLTIGIAYFRDTRTATVEVNRVAELKHAVTDPTYELSQLVEHGSDNDMFESLATETLVVPEKLQPNPIDYTVRILAKPIPSVFWASKPVSADELLNDTLFPSETVRASSSTGIVGSFYLAGALLGVVIGMLLFGILLRVPWEYLRLYPASSTPQLFLCATLMFIPILLRGSLSDTMAHLFFTVAPFWIGVRVCRRPYAVSGP